MLEDKGMIRRGVHGWTTLCRRLLEKPRTFWCHEVLREAYRSITDGLGFPANA